MLAKHVAFHAIDKKAKNVILMDLRKMSGATDFFVICTGDSDTQVKAIADAIRGGMAERGEAVWHSEGFQARQWILLDYVDVVVHVFHKEVRNFYNLERLWSDAKIHPVEDTGKTVKILPAVKRKSPRAQRPRRAASAR
ncbi:MAG: ribosome silencing factor [Bacteroidota bacterium]